MAMWIKENGVTYDVTPLNGKDFSLEELQRLVDGYIEIINLTDSEIMVINEEGKFSKEMNDIATMIAHRENAIFQSDYIAGDVLICNNNQVR